MDTFSANEERDGVRFSWNLWPTSKIESIKMVVPIGCMFTPLRPIENLKKPYPYHPVRCKKTGAVLNPFCQVDFRSKLWTCPFSLQRNHFPPQYAQNITESNLPAELIPQYTTIEYKLPSRSAGPPIFLYVIDTCIEKKELDELKDSIQQSLALLPDNALIGLVSFGRMVHVHELVDDGLPKSYVFRGHKEYTGPVVQELLGLVPRGRRQNIKAGGVTPPEATARFLKPKSECEFTVEQILDDMQPDPWQRKTGQRHQRCTGVALSIAAGLLEMCAPKRGSRIMMFIGGPPTIGPGAVADMKLSEPMRSHTDLKQMNNNARLTKKASEFYAKIGEKCAKNCHVVDLHCCYLDQIGLHEFVVCAERTGGKVVLADSFEQSVFKDSFKRIFAKDANGDLAMGFAATLEILTSREFSVLGAIGTCTSLKKKAPYVSQTEIGEGGTYAWSLAGIDTQTTIGMYFEITNPHGSPIAPTNRPHVQFVTTYQHSTGDYRMRVTTVALQWHHDPSSLIPVATSFDQCAAAALVARLASNRAKKERSAEIMRWLDRSLIRLCSKFAQYEKDKTENFHLPAEFTLYPQFMFHLRRSQFLQVFNCSPDESAFYRHTMMSKNVADTLIMVQPYLVNYTFSAAPCPVQLDVDSVKNDNILLLDTFFQVVVHHGTTIASWRDQGYHKKPDHENFRQLLQAPIDDAQSAMERRFPVPRFIICDQGRSQARFLMTKLNPSKPKYEGDLPQIFTDDVSLRVFMEHLVKLSVKST
eukprot:g3211.t1